MDPAVGGQRSLRIRAWRLTRRLNVVGLIVTVCLVGCIVLARIFPERL